MASLKHDPDEFWSSDEVERMGMEAAGLAWWLICRSWKNGPLKDDPKLYSAILGLRCPNFDDLWELARSVFEKGKDGLLRYQLVEDERDEYLGRITRDRERKRVSRMSQRHVRADSDRTPSGVSEESVLARASDRTGSDRTGPDRSKTSSPRKEPEPAAPIAADKPPPATSEHREFVEWWTQAFQATTGSPYGFQGAKDGQHVKRVLARPGGLEEAKRRAMILLACSPEWIAKGGIDLGTLDSQWNKLVSAGNVQVATGAKQAAIARTAPAAAALPPPAPRPVLDLYGSNDRKELR